VIRSSKRRVPGQRSEASGQGLAEFALIIPIFALMLFGIVDFGRVIWARNSLENAAREGARYAIVHGGTASQTCPVGPTALNPQVATPSCPFPSPLKTSIELAALAFAFAGGSGVLVTACYHTAGTTCTGNIDEPLITNARGTAVTVTVTSTLNLIVPSLLHLGSFPIVGSTTMLVNYCWPDRGVATGNDHVPRVVRSSSCSASRSWPS
jgi:hypothetical protein